MKTDQPIIREDQVERRPHGPDYTPPQIIRAEKLAEVTGEPKTTGAVAG